MSGVKFNITMGETADGYQYEMWFYWQDKPKVSDNLLAKYQQIAKDASRASLAAAKKSATKQSPLTEWAVL